MRQGKVVKVAEQVLRAQYNTFKSEKADLEEQEKFVKLRLENILNIISGSDEKKAVVLFEDDYSFKRNIEEWNKTHPDKTFSLIEVTPRSYEEE